MSHLDTTKVTAVGGRSGTVKSEDGILDLQVRHAMPFDPLSSLPSERAASTDSTG